MDVHKEVMGLCYQDKRRVYTKKREGVSIVKRRKRGSVQVHLRTIEKKVYQALKVASNGTSVFHREEEWKKTYGIGL